jgi:hypothetical protein
MCNDIQKKLDEIHANSKLHQIEPNKINRIIANKIKAKDMDYRHNLSNGKKGKKRPDMVGTNNPAYAPGVRENKIKRLKGVRKSKAQIKKYKETIKTLPDIICPYCGHVGRNQGNMNRYHLNKYCQTKNRA